MSRRLPKLAALVLLLLAAALWPHPTKAPPMAAADLAPSPVDDNLVPRALDRWFTFAAAQTTTTTTTRPRPSSIAPTDEPQFEAHFDPGSVQQIIVDVFGPAAPAALHVARCESGYDPTASNGTHWGVFQLGAVHRARAERLGFTWAETISEAYPNIVVAHDLYLEQGWRPWSCRP